MGGGVFVGIAEIGFIGTGVMGGSMAIRLLQHGYKVSIFNRSRHRATQVVAAGGNWVSSIAELSSRCEVLITMVGMPTDVEEVYFGPTGILEHARADSYLVDMTTSTPTLAVAIANAAKARGLHALDAPVSGGDVGAREGRLTIMVGGSEADFAAVQPVLACLGGNIVLQGGAGAGQHTKLCNQIAIASTMMGVAEAVVYAQQAGLDPQRVLSSIGAGAAGSWSLSNLAPRMIAADFAPGFYIKHMVKDLGIAVDEAKKLGVPTPGLSLSYRLYSHLQELGEQDSGTQALVKLLDGTLPFADDKKAFAEGKKTTER
ncbi:NAD(P)-dependent oxidoreductase [Alicyclobacillaceae bacterium I2511]|nr:NAD(P)-dependent oxidoreductase [Alicyclobacillaceae bacterium I2511]